MEILQRLGRGDLVVYVNEEYGFRQWYWFPNMTTDELHAYWETIKPSDVYMDITQLKGDWIECPLDNLDDDQWAIASADPRANVLLDEKFCQADEHTRAEMLRQYDAFQQQHYPNLAAWTQGFHDQASYRAHLHWDDDSWLRKPGETRAKRRQ